ncbi:helix-turn-helix domain-containing protein [Enterococcus hirae]|uniref:helix-turn-helix domain-containing protein n=1 Tax=Enterococcus hirae TaxID=1354 RepID=UPI000F6EACA4|nr:helix-turn-helix transcriptional regulator [Enterococcus hirae]VEE82199.1 Cro/CI family transcriptional regulator [Enterococcus hirae]
MSDEIFRHRLKKLRLEKKLTLEELAKIIGTTKTTLSRYENGERSPKLQIVGALANYFNVDMTWLSGLEDNNQHPPELLSLDKKIAANIKKIRTQKQLSKEHVADKVGISVQELTLYEEQQKTFTIDVVFNFAKALGVTFDDLFPAEGKFDEIPAILKVTEEENKVETASGEIYYLTDEEMIFLKNFLIFTNRK